jgi:hypothetical protein
MGTPVVFSSQIVPYAETHRYRGVPPYLPDFGATLHFVWIVHP